MGDVVHCPLTGLPSLWIAVVHKLPHVPLRGRPCQRAHERQSPENGSGAAPFMNIGPIARGNLVEPLRDYRGMEIWFEAYRRHDSARAQTDDAMLAPLVATRVAGSQIFVGDCLEMLGGSEP